MSGFGTVSQRSRRPSGPGVAGGARLAAAVWEACLLAVGMLQDRVSQAEYS